jgi:16S rRNA (cytosine967-C5)-methyltransferase
MDSPRELTIKAIGLVLKGPGRPKEVLDSLLTGMERRERAFVMEMVYGVLRYRDMLDLVLSWLMKKPTGVQVRTRNNLRAGLYQIFFMRVPEWAAVNEAVELEGRQSRLVNGVLRNAIRKRDDIEARLAVMEKEALGDDLKVAAGAISALASHPQWLVKRWVSRMGVKEANLLARCNNEIPPLTLCVNSLRAGRDEVIAFLRQKGIACEPTSLSPVGVRLESTVPFEELGIGGLALVQDEAAQLVSLMLSPEPGQRVLDACAAPGGKTVHMAAMMEDRGEMVALDMDGSRLERLMENVRAMGINSVSAVHEDLMKYDERDGFDSVLLDAPCSATGVIRRNPDIKYRRKRRDLARYSETQYGLLKAASGLLRPDGRMVYAVCSTEPEEGEIVVERFLKSYADFYIIDDVPSVPSRLMQGGYMRTWPHRDGLDGFFAVLLARGK